MTKVTVYKKEKPIFDIENFYKLKVYDHQEFENVKNLMINSFLNLISKMKKSNTLFIEINQDKNSNINFDGDYLSYNLEEEKEEENLKMENYVIYTRLKNISEILYFIGYYTFSSDYRENIFNELTIDGAIIKIKIFNAIENKYDIEFSKKFRFIKDLNLRNEYINDVSKIKRFFIKQIRKILNEYFDFMDFILKARNFYGFYINLDYEAFLKNKLKLNEKYIIVADDIINKIGERKFKYKGIVFDILSSKEFLDKYKNDENIIFHNSYCFLFNFDNNKEFSGIPINLIFDFAEYKALLALNGNSRKNYFYFVNFIKDNLLKMGLFEKLFYKLIGDNYESNDNVYTIKKNITVNNKKIDGTISKHAIERLIHLNMILNDIIVFGDLKRLLLTHLVNSMINFSSIFHSLSNKFDIIKDIAKQIDIIFDTFFDNLFNNNDNNEENENENILNA